ncbi:MAG: HAD-IA family hydrolase [Tateyamaria sp.]
MSYSALLLGSIGVLTETSELQRRSFNTAFEENELVWHWDAATYKRLLEVPGGKARLRHYAQVQGVEVDIDAIYESKLAAFEGVIASGAELRPGIADLIAEAQEQGMQIGFVTSTDPRQVAAILKGLKGDIDPSVFDYIGDSTQVARTKPAPDIYKEALRAMSVTANDALAIEDTPDSARAAVAAGIRTVGYPGAAASDRDFGTDVEMMRTLHVSLLRQQANAA